MRGADGVRSSWPCFFQVRLLHRHGTHCHREESTKIVGPFGIKGWSWLARATVSIAAAIRLRKLIDNEWLLVRSGVLSVVFGALMLWQPGARALAVVRVIGSCVVFLGVLPIALGRCGDSAATARWPFVSPARRCWTGRRPR